MARLEVYESSHGYILARVRENGSLEAPLTLEGRNLTGCRAVTGSVEYVADSPHVTKYKTIEDAKVGRLLLEG